MRAVFLADKFLSPNTIAFDAKDTSNIYWRTRNFFREFLARTKAVLVRCIRKSRRTQPESIMDIVHNSVYGETHAYCLWHNRYWEVFGEEGKYIFSAMTTRCPDMSLFDSLVSDITNEMGNPVKAHLYVPMMEDWPENHPDFEFAEWHNDSVRVSLHYNSLDEYTEIEIAALDDSLNVIDHWFDDAKYLYHLTIGDELN